jgi:hypothetical protein
MRSLIVVFVLVCTTATGTLALQSSVGKAGSTMPIIAAPAAARAEIERLLPGSWRGQFQFADHRRNFSSAEITIRFTNYGVASISRGAVSGPVVISGPLAFNADYTVAGNSVLLSVHSSTPVSGILLLGVHVTEDTLEFVTVPNANWLGGDASAFRLRRE